MATPWNDLGKALGGFGDALERLGDALEGLGDALECLGDALEDPGDALEGPWGTFSEASRVFLGRATWRISLEGPQGFATRTTLPSANHELLIR